MKPFEDDNPRESWHSCPGRACKQLSDGRLWKCAPIAYLPMQNAKYHLSEEWWPYLEYQPLSPDCSDQQLAEFLAREEEDCCSMCPASPEVIPLPMPLRGSSSGSEIAPKGAESSSTRLPVPRAPAA
jgi:hypothetical protein